MINRKQLKYLLIGMLLALAACGGGGGGTPQAVTYNGVTTQATVTSTNAKALSVDAYQGGQIGSSAGAIGVITEVSAPQPDASRLQWLGTTLTAAARQAVAAPTVASAPTLVGVTSQADVAGAYGGSFHYSISVDEASGSFSGTLTFSSYRNAANGGSLSGSVSFSGIYNQTTQSFTSFNLTIGSLTVTEAGNSVSVYGTISLNHSVSTESISMSLVLSDGATGRTYWVKDFTYTVSPTGTTTLSGTYYDPIHGYVTIATITPLAVATPGAWPTAGQLLFSGANGSKARLTFTVTGYTVEVDQNGTGVFTVVP